jgi:hypothetical protein
LEEFFHQAMDHSALGIDVMAVAVIVIATSWLPPALCST